MQSSVQRQRMQIFTPVDCSPGEQRARYHLPRLATQKQAIIYSGEREARDIFAMHAYVIESSVLLYRERTVMLKEALCEATSR